MLHALPSDVMNQPPEDKISPANCGRPADAYHSCYCLAGLSAAQHQYRFDDSLSEQFQSPLAAPFGWYADTSFDLQQATGALCDSDDMVAPIHPVYVIPRESAEKARRYFETRQDF
jgi:protein farnesyltransferase subunit beta